MGWFQSLRNQMISFTCFKHKVWRIELKRPEKRQDIELEYFKFPSQDLFKELDEHRAKYHVLSINKATKGLLKLKQT